ncbi:MAG: TetR/AcrR family transcriptional regulator [Gammaproteobacteria bacterium]|nr:TetR/AcrR family transcriptional regulator [Gammaproteobacteria bacterium]
MINVADDLFYQKGFENTSFTDIADTAGIARGNFYYYFKSKDDILAAVLSKRSENIRELLSEWEKEYPEPAERLKNYALMLVKSQSTIENFGCPLGAMCLELNKLRHALQDDASGMLELFREWLSKQFSALGHEADASKLAMHMLGRCQGISLITSAYNDLDYLNREVDALQEWIDTLSPGYKQRPGQ